jgi:hypothetical protein
MNVFRGSAPQWRTRRDPTTKLFFETTSPDWSYPLAYGYAAVGKVERLGDAAASLGAPHTPRMLRLMSFERVMW